MTGPEWAFPVGSRCEILPAYSMETGDRSEWDEIAGCEAIVIGHTRAGDVRVQVTAMHDEHFVHFARLKRLG